MAINAAGNKAAVLAVINASLKPLFNNFSTTTPLDQLPTFDTIWGIITDAVGQTSPYITANAICTGADPQGGIVTSTIS